MIELDEGVPAWWDRLDDGQREQFVDASQNRRLDDNARDALLSSGCPVNPTTAVKYDDTEGYVWFEPIRQYVLLQPWWDRLDDSDRKIARWSLETGYELRSEAVEMFTRTHCPVMLANHGYPPDPKSWIVSLPDSLHALISHKFGL